MVRVELLDAATAPISVQQFFGGGDPGPIVAALANVPEILGPTLGFLGLALGDGAATTRHKEFAILRTSALQGCRYCVQTHSAVALDVGLTEAEVRGLRGELELEATFPDVADQRLLRWIDAMAGATGPVSDEVWNEVRVSFAAHVLVDLSVTIGATMFLNRFATGFELPTSAATLSRLEKEGMQ